MHSIHEQNIHTVHETHESDVLHDDFHPDNIYKIPSALDAPPPRDGYTQRWIRYDTAIGKDEQNSMKKTREGWRPRAIETIPDEYKATFTSDRKGLGHVYYSQGMVLCEMSIERARHRNAVVRKRNDDLQSAVDNRIESINQKIGGHGGFGAIQKYEDHTDSVGGREMVIQKQRGTSYG